jgi:formylglycine-generating enzyme required for sulfatase activity
MQEPDGKEMVRVPPGPFLYGDGKERSELPEFWIDRTPVTNAEYAQFVAATGWKGPRHWKDSSPPEAIADHPVTEVSWRDAAACAEWAGKRLPTEQEWEKAARGTEGQEYPWGDQEPTRELCNFEDNEGGTTPVGKYSPQGDSPYGGVDMAGNVYEWTASDYDADQKVLRGGSWLVKASLVRCAHRNRGHPDSPFNHSMGFRCARSSE